MSVGLLICSASFTACLPDAEKDYEDFRADTADVRGKKVIDFSPQGGAGGAGGEAGAGGDAGSPGLAEIGGTFQVTCLPSISGGDPAKALRFVGKVELTKDSPEATSGTASFTFTPLKIPATSLADTSGTSFSTSSPVAVSVGEPFTLALGDNVSVPGDANPISGSEILLNNVSMKVRVRTSDFLCSELDGQAVKPLMIDLAAAESVDVCLFDRVPEGTDAVAAVTDASRFVPCD
jgi:hypothetical protein